MGKSKKISPKINMINILDLFNKLENINDFTVIFKEVNVFLKQKFPKVQFTAFEKTSPPECLIKVLDSNFSDEIFGLAKKVKMSMFKHKLEFYILNKDYYYFVKDKLDNGVYLLVFRNLGSRNLDEIRTLCGQIQNIYQFAKYNYNQGFETSMIKNANIISQICHDFNSFISIINTKNEFKNTALSEKLNYSIKMTKDILLYVRELELLKSDVNVTELVESIIEKIAMPDNIQINLINKVESKNIYLDVELIDRAINEIINNAINAIGNKISTINIELESRNFNTFFSGFECFVLRIVDNGCGIKEDFLPFIKNPFFTTIKSESHSGLGLSIAEKIIKEHQGFVDINSKPGMGTVASIFLPFNESEVRL